MLPYDLCELIGWIDQTSISFHVGNQLVTIPLVTRPGPYLIMKKLGSTLTVSRSLTIQNVLDRFE